MANLEINGRIFRDIDSYNSAKRDKINIERIRERIDFTRLEDVTRLRDNILNGRYRFESVLGQDFTDELDDIILELERSQRESNESRSRVGRKREKPTNASLAKDSNPKRQRKADEKKAFSSLDDDMQQEVMRIIQRSERKRRIWVGLLTLVLIISIGYLAFYYVLYGKNDAEYKELASLKQETSARNEVSINYTVEEDMPPILKKYETLYQKNKKLVGWLTIDDTSIDYPVMQTENNDYYLEHNYNQEYDKNGSIFLDCTCNPAFPNDNMIIYGHNMKSGKMFGSLKKYASIDFYKKHPQIRFDTIYEEGIYDVMYVFRSRIFSEEEIVFKYYQFIDATSENEFESNMEEMSRLSLYDTGITANYGDRLITLSTCDSSETNGRFVVVAKKVR